MIASNSSDTPAKELSIASTVPPKERPPSVTAIPQPRMLARCNRNDNASGERSRGAASAGPGRAEIGRASCRERVESGGGEGCVQEGSANGGRGRERST